MAQAAHAANQCVFEHGRNNVIKQWQKDAKGFGTTICLAASKADILSIVTDANALGALAGLTFDPTYKYSVDTEVADFIPSDSHTAPAIFQSNGLVTLFRNEITCGYVFVPDGHTEVKKLIEALPLHP